MADQAALTHWADILVVVVYFVLVLSVGLLSLFRQNRKSVKSFFLAGRSMPWFTVGASLFSSNIGSEHFIGLAGTGAASGVAIVLYEWLAMLPLLLAAWLFLPVYVSAGVYTLPEYMQKRFGGQRVRIYLSVLAVILYIITKLAVSIFAGGLFIQLSLGWNMYLSIIVLLVVTASFTLLGGLTAVMYTDTFQTVVMTIGSLILVGIGFNHIGGFTELKQKYHEAIPSIRSNNTTCGLPRDDAFHILRHPVTSDNPWPGLLLQSTVGVIWYFCCDQVMVQRSLAAANLLHAKAGAVMAGYLKILPMFIMILPGMLSRALYPDSVGCVDEDECMRYCGNPVGCSNIAYPKLVLELLPTGLRGFLMAVMLSAIMSSLTSILNSASTIFTMDLWRRLRSDASERELLIVGRVFVLVMCAVSILWIPLVKAAQSGQLFLYIQVVQGYLGTQIGAVFTLAILWKRMTEQAAFWGLVLGHTCGIIRMVMDFSMPAPACGEPEYRPAILYKVHYTYFGVMLFVLTSSFVVAISYMTNTTQDELEGVTWHTRLTPSNLSLRVAASNDEGDPNESRSLKAQATTNDDLNVNEVKLHQSIARKNRWQRCLTSICAIPEKNGGTTFEDKHKDTEEARQFLHENVRWRTVVNTSAVAGLMAIAFLVGWFA